MSVITDIADVFEKKDAAIMKAIEYLGRFDSCSNRTCDPDDHWRGCPEAMRPLIKELTEAMKLR